MPIRYPDPPPFLPRAERDKPSPHRAIACRSCGAWTRIDEEGRWHHEADGTLACVDPESMAPYPEARRCVICSYHLATDAHGETIHVEADGAYVYLAHAPKEPAA